MAPNVRTAQAIKALKVREGDKSSIKKLLGLKMKQHDSQRHTERYYTAKR
jgi:hypothetical protein